MKILCTRIFFYIETVKVNTLTVEKDPLKILKNIHYSCKLLLLFKNKINPKITAPNILLLVLFMSFSVDSAISLIRDTWMLD